MATTAQIEANKKNALSGGVKTIEGKEISKYNALKHGIFKQVYSARSEIRFFSVRIWL